MTEKVVNQIAVSALEADRLLAALDRVDEQTVTRLRRLRERATAVGQCRAAEDDDDRPAA